MIVAGAAAATVLFAADVVGGGFDPYSLIASTGIPGVVIVLLLMGKLRTESEVKRLESQLEAVQGVVIQKDGLIEKLNATIADRAIPALTRSTQALERLSEQRP